MDSLQQNCPLPLHPFPPKNGGTGATPTRQKEQLSGYILILQDDYRKVTFLNCLTGLYAKDRENGDPNQVFKGAWPSTNQWRRCVQITARFSPSAAETFISGP